MPFKVRTSIASLALSLTLGICSCAQADGYTLSASQACDQLKQVIANARSAPHGSKEYHCERDPAEGGGRYYVFALRSNFPSPAKASSDWVGSALVGWFAVSKESGDVYEWDVGNDALGKKLARVNSKR